MEQKYSLLSHNTFGIDVSVACFLEYASVDELRGLIGSGRVTSPYLHIGGGSNLLFTKDYEGTILHSRIGGVEVVAETDDDIVVRVGAGVVWDDFVHTPGNKPQTHRYQKCYVIKESISVP